MNPKQLSVTIGGKTLIFETGLLGRHAHGSVTVRLGDTLLFASACRADTVNETVDFLPFRVDYTEKFSSAGKTLGGYIKREGKPTEREILTSRLIDRPLRPLFPEGFYKEVQILSYVFSYDQMHLPEPLAICAASAALVLSDIPLLKPVGAVRVGLIQDRFVINPTLEEMKSSKLDLILAGTANAILMIEGYCDFLTEETLLEAIEEGHAAIKILCEALADWQNVVGKPKDMSGIRALSHEIKEEIKRLAEKDLIQAHCIASKREREARISAAKEKVLKILAMDEKTKDLNPIDIAAAFKALDSEVMRHMILNEHKRSDGRKLDEIRPIWIRPDYLPRAHGSVIFTRGETQTLAVCTLGGHNAALRFEDLNTEGSRKFYLQYAFPPFSVGEVGKAGPPGRREIGHGKLAERALASIIPDDTLFPYVIRLESNITESNGSSSMASVCGGCLAMMNAGVPLKRPISGIAMGLILEGDHFVILSDILGVEDALGDMDFKITGDFDGITAFQLDIKVEGITPKIMRAALMQAKEGRAHILQKMLEVLPESNKHLSPYAPRIEIMRIKPSQIAIVIGPGGKQIRAITEETGVDVNINDEGVISLASTNAEGLAKAKEIIFNLTAELEIDKVYRGQITSIVDFGMFVKIYNKEGLCHISEISHERIDNIEDFFKEGDMIDVKVIEITQRGQFRLSHKALRLPPTRTPRPPTQQQDAPRKPNILAPPPFTRK